jgi:hypothetical protein
MNFLMVVENEEERLHLSQKLEADGHQVTCYRNLGELSQGLEEHMGPPADALLSTDLEILIKISFLVKSNPRLTDLLRLSIIYLGADGNPLGCQDTLARKLSSAVSVTSIFSKYLSKISHSLHWNAAPKH